MKKRNLIAVLMMTAALAAGCGAKADTTTAAPTQAETTLREAHFHLKRMQYFHCHQRLVCLHSSNQMYPY